jgi:hypothetical protein
MWWWLGFAAVFGGSLLAAPSALAQRVTRECPQLSDARWQELEARLRVLLGVHGRPDLGVELRCGAAAPEVVLSDEGAVTRLPLENGELVEVTLAAVEAELARSRALPTDVAPETPETPDTPAAAPAPPRDARSASPRTATPKVSPPTPAARRPSPERESPLPVLSGGIGLGLGVETWGSEWPALGPRLHLALGHADVCVVAVEALGFGRLERHDALTFSTELGAAWGAPYAPLRAFGAQLLLGHEWLSASENAAAPTQTSGVWSVSLGARAAVPVAPVSFFVGPDFRVRLGKNELGPPLAVGLPAYSLLVQAGAFWIQEAMPAQR